MDAARVTSRMLNEADQLTRWNIFNFLRANGKEGRLQAFRRGGAIFRNLLSRKSDFKLSFVLRRKKLLVG